MSKKIVLTENSSLFYGKNDLLGFSYYYYLPKLSPRERKEISEKITNFKGVNFYILLLYRKFQYLSKRSAL